MQKLITISLLATAFLGTKHATAAPVYTFDPGPVGSLFNEYWQSAQFPLDEPLSTVRFEVADGKLLNFLPDVGQSWRFGMRTSNHGLSQNYTAQKTLTFYDAEGAILLAEDGLDSTVHTQSGGTSLWSASPLLGIAAIEINYEPGVPEVGDDAGVFLFFNERIVTGTLQVVAVPEPNSALLALSVIPFGLYRHRRFSRAV